MPGDGGDRVSSTLTLVFTTSASWISRAIRFFDRSPASHVSVLFESAELGGTWVLEADLSGVRLRPEARWARGKRVVARFRARTDLSAGLRAAASLVGRRYDVTALFGFAWVILVGRWLGRRVRNPLASPRAYVCSEFVVHLRDGAAIPEFQGLDPERTSPRVLWRVLKDGTTFEEIP